MRSKWSWLGIIAGIIFSVGSFIRYYIIYPDLSEVVIGVSLGISISGVAYLYGEIQKLRGTFDYFETVVQDKIINYKHK